MRCRVAALRDQSTSNHTLPAFRAAPRFAVTVCAVLVSGCFLPRGGGGTLVSSADSDYSPVVTFNAQVRVTDSVRVSVDRMRIVSPGEVFPGQGASTGLIEMQALLVTSNPNANSPGAVTADRNGASKPWLERSASASVNVADSLVSGIPQTTGRLQFALGLPAGVSPAESWLVFRLSGPAKAMAARMADGSAAPSFALPAIRVFACAVKNLNGKTDDARVKVMKESYSMAC